MSPRVAAIVNAMTLPDKVGQGLVPTVRGLVASGKPVLVLATGLPYDLGLFPRIRAAVASYSGSGVSLGAAAAVLTGRLSPAGRLPVAIPAAAGTRRSLTAPVVVLSFAVLLDGLGSCGPAFAVLGPCLRNRPAGWC